MAELLSVDDALQAVLARVEPLAAERVPIEQASGRVLAHQRGYRIAELPVNHRARVHGRSRYGVERYLRGFFDLLTVSFIGRYRHRPLHLFGGLGLLTIAGGIACLLYLTVLKAQGHSIGSRPLLILGVLLVVVGVQLLSLGLIGEMITSLHEERADERSRAQAVVDEVLTRS